MDNASDIYAQTLSYAKFIFITPAVLLSSFWIVFLILMISIVFLGADLKPILGWIPFISYISKDGTFHVGNAEILRIFWYISLVFYLINLVISAIFKIHIFLSLKRQMFIGFIVPLLFMIPGYSLFVFTQKVPVSMHLLLMFFAFAALISNQLAIIVSFGTNYFVTELRKVL